MKTSNGNNIAIIGAGSLGLFTAFELAKQGYEVTVYERLPLEELRNASWGNAGHVVPIMSVPLSSRANIVAAVRGVIKKDSFMRLPKSLDMNTSRFLLEFVRNSGKKTELRGMRSLRLINELAIPQFEKLQDQGLVLGFERAPFVSAFQKPSALLEQVRDFAGICGAGSSVRFDLLDKEELHRVEPLSAAVGNLGLVLHDQGLVQPPLLIRSLLEALVDLNVQFKCQTVTAVKALPSGDITVESSDLSRSIHTKAIICSGAWMDELAREHGVGPQVLAGFGYSLSVAADDLPQGMLYFPEAKVATTRMGNELRISTLMQIDRPGAKFDSVRGAQLKRLGQRAVPSAHWETAKELWSGGRPISNDGLPMIGETHTKNVYVNGGHGMWGITLGPISGRLLAKAVMEGKPDIDLPGFSPRRRL